MKSRHTTIMAILLVTLIAGLLTVTIQQASAPRNCAGCTAFKKLTHEFEKNVINAATTGDPNLISGLLEQYKLSVIGYFDHNWNDNSKYSTSICT
jgi:hypothetical protein